MTLRPGRIDIGSATEISHVFINSSGVAFNPSTVAFRVRSPCGIESRYVYGTDSAITRPSTGNYLATITPNEAGKWVVRWVATVPALEIQEFFYVQCSPFLDQQAFSDYV